MTKNKKNFRASRRLVVAMCCLVILIMGTVTVNAATGGLIGQYFENLFGGEKGIAVITYEQDGEQIRLEISVENSQVGIYDENNELVKDLTEEQAGSIEFSKDNQSCTLDGREYKVNMVIGVNEETGDFQNQIRLYQTDDYAKAMESFDPEQIFEGEDMTVYSPYITIE